MDPAARPWKILILGAGRVGEVLGRAWGDAGHGITFGARDPESPKTQGVVAQCGLDAKAVPVAGSAAESDVIVVATPWLETERIIGSLGDLRGKVVIDATNPIVIGADELSRGLLVGHSTSGAEEIARWAPEARVVKGFNTTGTGNLADPVYGDRRLPTFICGDDGDAKRTAAILARQVGLEPLDVGGLPMARYLEPMALLWIKLAYGQGWGPDFAFDVLRR